MAYIAMDVALVTDSVAKARAEIAQQGAALQSIAGEVDLLGSVWDDAAQRMYAERFQAKKKQIEEFDRSLDRRFANIQSLVRQCVDRDKNMARDLANISW